MSALFVLTRHDPVDSALAGEAERLGVRVLRLRLLETERGSDGDRFLEWMKRPPAGAAIAWTSKRAAETLAGLVLPHARETLARISLFTLGSESAAPIREAGLTVEVCPDGEGAASLADWILLRRADRAVACVAFLHGDKALPKLPETLRRAGVDVQGFELYRTRFLSPDVSALAAALAAGTPVAAAVFSPSGVEALERLLPPEGVASLRRDVQAIPRGETTYQALVARGYLRARKPARISGSFDSFALEALQSS